jgi:hypothetical protein
MRLRLVACCVLFFACSSSSSGPPEPPLTNATSLQCPAPGNLPFRLASSGFQNADNATLVTSDTRIKDQASDAIGNPNGSSANIYLADTGSPANGIADYQGLKARTTPAGGLTATPLPGEFVSLWAYDTGSLKWMTLGRTQTDANGNYDIPTTLGPDPGTPVYALLEADGSCAEHYDYLLKPGSKVVVADIDGTLTTSNDELFKEISDDTYVPAMMTDANVLMQTWASKKYTVIYLTARAHLFRAETRQWLEGLSFPIGTVITSNATLASDDATIAYKSAWLSRMVKTFGWDIVAAYGNEDTDIKAYQSVNIPDADIFIVGPSGGDLGSTAIPNNDFTAHIKSFVDAQPDND